MPSEVDGMSLARMSAEKAMVTRVQKLVETGKFQEALPLCESAEKKYPRNSAFKYYKAFTLQQLKQKPEEALRLYGEALDLGYDEFWVSYHRGLLYLDIGQTENARKDLEHALNIAPAKKQAQNVEQVLKGLPSAAPAEKVVEETAVSEAPVAPVNEEANEIRECQKLVDSGNFTKGLARSEAASKRFPNNAGANYYQAYCLHRLGKRLDKAVALYTKALDQGYDKYWVFYHRGLLFGMMGKKNKAQEDLRRAVQAAHNPQQTEDAKKAMALYK